MHAWRHAARAASDPMAAPPASCQHDSNDALCPWTCSTDVPATGQPFGFALSRKPPQPAAATAAGGPATAATAAPLFDTRGTNLIFKEQYIELTTAVPQDSVLYGLGETAPHQAGAAGQAGAEGGGSGGVKPGNGGPSLALPRDGRTVALWNLDAAPTTPGMNVYGGRSLHSIRKGCAAAVCDCAERHC